MVCLCKRLQHIKIYHAPEQIHITERFRMHKFCVWRNLQKSHNRRNAQILFIYFTRWYSIQLLNCKHSNCSKVEVILEQRQVAFLSPSKIWENLNFSRESQILQILLGDKNATSLCSKNISTLTDQPKLGWTIAHPALQSPTSLPCYLVTMCSVEERFIKVAIA